MKAGFRTGLAVLLILTAVFVLPGCAAASGTDSGKKVSLPGLVYESSLPLSYATEFTADEYKDGYTLIRVKDKRSYLVVPEGKKAPQGLDKNIVVLQKPLDHIYLAASSVMSLFDALDSVDSVTLSGTKADGWSVEHAKKAMEDGKIVYAGKYSAPNYELLTGSGCRAAIESTMILHAPKVSQMIEQLGIPVVVDRSSL